MREEGGWGCGNGGGGRVGSETAQEVLVKQCRLEGSSPSPRFNQTLQT